MSTVLACVVVGILLAVIIGLRAVSTVESSLGSAYADNLTRYNKQRLLSPLLRELSLSQRLADSEVTRAWLSDLGDPAKKAFFFAEAERYRRTLSEQMYFIIPVGNLGYYFNDARGKWSDQPRYFVHREKKEDGWYFATLRSPRDFNINVDYDRALHTTKVWFNIIVRAYDGRPLGVAGTGLDFTGFLDRFIRHHDPGVTPIIVQPNGAIQAHPNRSLIDYSSVSVKEGQHRTLYALLRDPRDADAMRRTIDRVRANPDGLEELRVSLEGEPRLVTLSYLPELSWVVLTAVDLRSAHLLPARLWLPPLAAGGVLLTLMILAVVLAVDRIVVAPVLRLTDSVRAIAQRNYEVSLPPPTHDELGELTRSFGTMAARVRSHTDELEMKVAERTRELVAVNAEIERAHREISDSIEYASLIQSSILPRATDLPTAVGTYAALWQPRDGVGGDTYTVRETEDGVLYGVVDCAGHGVPGALMPMTVHGALEAAVEAHGIEDPSRLLQAIDIRLQQMRGRKAAPDRWLRSSTRPWRTPTVARGESGSQGPISDSSQRTATSRRSRVDG